MECSTVMQPHNAGELDANYCTVQFGIMYFCAQGRVSHTTNTWDTMLNPNLNLKVHKNENCFGFDFEFCTISVLVMHK